MTPCKPLYCEFIDTERLNAALRPWRAEAMPAGALVLLPEAERESFPVLRQACLDAGLAFVGAIFPAISLMGASRGNIPSAVCTVS